MKLPLFLTRAWGGVVHHIPARAKQYSTLKGKNHNVDSHKLMRKSIGRLKI